MRPMPFAIALGGLAVLLTGLTASGLAACSKSPEGPTIDTSSERIVELERRLNELSQQREATGLATGVSGAEFQSVQKSLRDAQDRVKALEERLAALPTGVVPPPTAPVEGSSGATPVPAIPPSWVAGPDGTYTEEQVSAFRKLADEVQERKDFENNAERVKKDLARAAVTLSPEQESAVIKLQWSYKKKLQDLFKGGFGTTEPERQAAIEKREVLKGQFESELRGMVPASEADKIVEGLKRGMPGFFPNRRQDNVSSTGMGGRVPGMGSLDGG